jgi:hypothetical protein
MRAENRRPLFLIPRESADPSGGFAAAWLISFVVHRLKGYDHVKVSAA